MIPVLLGIGAMCLMGNPPRRKQRKAKPRRNPYSRQLVDLSRFLGKGELDGYDVARLLGDWIEDESPRLKKSIAEYIDDGSYWQAYDELTKPQQKAFTAWASNHLDLLRPEETPSVALMSPKGRRGALEGLGNRQDWLIHFTDNAADIASAGFRYGHQDAGTLALTVHKSERERRSAPGWNFAYHASSKDAVACAERRGNRTGYGRDAVLFQAAGVHVFHHSDDESQAIFWGPDVHEVIPLFRVGDGGGGGTEWSVRDKRTNRDLRVGNYLSVVNWAQRHRHQYRKRIVYTPSPVRD